MDEKSKKEFFEELESKYLMIKKGSVYYFLGGLLATAIAIIGLSYASAKSAIESEVAILAIEEIEKIKKKAIQQQNEMSEILAATPGAIESVPYLKDRVKRISQAISSFAQPFDPSVAKFGYLYPKGYFRDPELESLVKDLGKASEKAQRILRSQ